ncbi:uncharacterized protein LOC113744580 [Larimichthys crocea]|uniref:uncharacterized protein LOC113744580 n=1 Tax=Larimichthys crocea TaxID=215358 RepID=UPI000F60207C|nr:uncharacterized protein LOC113744580 [Larimichthys crocea]
MDLINWSLSAIDTIYSMRSPGLGEPKCPAGTFAAGYSMDVWEKWRVVCLAALSVEDAEDVYLFWMMMTSVLLIGSGIALLHRGMRKTLAAVQSPVKLPVMIEELSRAVGSLNETLNRHMENIRALNRKVDDITKTMNRNMVTITGAMDNIKINRDMDNITEKLTVLQRALAEAAAAGITTSPEEHCSETLLCPHPPPTAPADTC